MDKDFWIEAWSEGRIGFHQSEYNSVMVNHYEKLELENKNVFIPLAGKSKDIFYFLERQANVFAVEVSRQAVEEFFKENKIAHKLEKTDKYTIYKAQNLTFYLGDFFSLTSSEISTLDFLYDRASVVALPQKLRESYFKKISELIGRHTNILIQTQNHDGPKNFGPPFMVPEEEIKNAYQHMGIELNLVRGKSFKPEERFTQAGISKMTRLVWKN